MTPKPHSSDAHSNVATLQTIVERLRADDNLKTSITGLDNIRIDHLAQDSRKVGPGGLFVAIRGTEADGHLFIDKSVQNGAVAIVCEEVPGDAIRRYPGISFVHVHNSRRALSLCAAVLSGDPSREMSMVGVTGTNGKTTSTFLIHQLLTHLGSTAGLIGTIEARVGTQPISVTHTTPDAIELQSLLRRMAQGGCEHVAMEVSSHALDQWRVHGIDFQVAVFTNLTREHLDYHPSFDAYFLAKKQLFDRLSASATALFNIDDPLGARIVTDCAAKRVSFGFDARADIRIELLANRVDGLHLCLDGHERRFRLVGRFNAYNIAAAYGAAVALGFSPEEVLSALSEAPPVPGRFEQITFGDATTVIVDYAHTPDALENVLKTIAETKSEHSKVWCIFGCGGNRDTSKRRVMGSIAEALSDRVIVTNDNPRFEDPQNIMNDIRRGMSRPTEARWIVDRREAIQYAAEHSSPGDIVLIAGKGHETYQIVGGETRQFDDRAEARSAFAHRGNPKIANTH
jgi:UDP-N-acetylmuramoyl-L-alanyl-D-glutamate--2,6-diaminopimelate ligase